MKITVFTYPGCPYCRQMTQILEELRKEKSIPEDLQLEFLDETEVPEIAEQKDYYYCPSFFAEERKLYEAKPGRSREEAKRMILQALASVI